MVEKINLLFGEKFISLAKMPRMLAEAMNPAPTHRTLNCLTKSEGEKKGSSLENDDYEKLLQIWEGLPPPPENATEQELQPYIEAANSSGAFTWKLGAVYKDSQYKLIRQIAVVELTAEIKKAIEAKQLTALWPHTRTAVDKWNDTALVSVEELSKYAAKKGLDVDFERPETLEPVAPASAVTEQAASGSPAPAGPKVAPVGRGWVMKKAALIAKHKSQWPTINRDFQDASENNLSRDAKAPGHGEWFEADALNWARQRGKYSEAIEQPIANKATPFGGLTHRIKG